MGVSCVAVDCGVLRDELKGCGDCGIDGEKNICSWEVEIEVVAEVVAEVDDALLLLKFIGVSASLLREEEVVLSASSKEVTQF